MGTAILRHRFGKLCQQLGRSGWGLEESLYKHEGPRFGLGQFQSIGWVLCGATGFCSGSLVSIGTVTLKESDARHHTKLNVGRILRLCPAPMVQRTVIGLGCQRFGFGAVRIYIHAEVKPRACGGRCDDRAAEVLFASKVTMTPAVVLAKSRSGRKRLVCFVSDTSWLKYSLAAL